ncbi:hypothetical protein I3263_17120 [Photobacterium damselae]|uniref:hypothetical protein n=2 Tax=Photobacterium damselae TaxID=38293 RepID=UPI00187F90AA|nr:hypothetical protein [Photobacterium damselae]MCG3826253.1 hypothetical protein [Photobacterium damselae]
MSLKWMNKCQFLGFFILLALRLVLVFLPILFALSTPVVLAARTYNIHVVKRYNDNSCIEKHFTDYSNSNVTVHVSIVSSTRGLITTVRTITDSKDDLVVIPNTFRHQNDALNALNSAGIPTFVRNGIAPEQLVNGKVNSISLSTLYQLQGSEIRKKINQDLKKNGNRSAKVYIIYNAAHVSSKGLNQEIKNCFSSYYDNKLEIASLSYSAAMKLPRLRDGDYVVSALPSPHTALLFKRLEKARYRISLIASDLLMTDDSFRTLIREDKPKYVHVSYVAMKDSELKLNKYKSFMAKYCPQRQWNLRDVMLFDMLDMANELLKSGLLATHNLVDSLNLLQYIPSFKSSPYQFSHEGINSSDVEIRDYHARSDLPCGFSDYKGKPKCKCVSGCLCHDCPSCRSYNDENKSVVLA